MEVRETEAASIAFAARDVKDALGKMHHLKQQRDNDTKVQHNFAIAEYVEGGQRDPTKLLGTLEQLKERLENAHARVEEGEGDVIGEADPSLAAYNMAVLYYQLKQYAKCRSLLEDMFSNIEPIDEFLAFKLCFLLLDVYLLQKQAERAAEVLTYVEKSFAALTTKGDGEVGRQPNGEAASGDVSIGAATLAVPVIDSPGGKMLPSLGRADGWPNKRSSRRPPTDVTTEEVRGALALYKAKLALMARSSKSSKREIKTTLNACAQNTTGLFLKCNLEWQRQNYRKAIKLLNNSCQAGAEREKNVSALYFNNMGCIHHCMRRHQAAAFYFTRALQENDALYQQQPTTKTVPGGDGKTTDLPTYNCDRRCELEYNRGLQYHLSGRPTAAFACFLAALELMHSHPRVWLRLGETCVAQHVLQEKQLRTGAGTPSVSPLVSALAQGPSRPGGGGASSLDAHVTSRYLVLPTDGPSAAGRGESAGPPPEEAVAHAEIGSCGASTGSPAPAAPTLAFGLKCLRNALVLCTAQLGGSGAPAVSAADYAQLLSSSANGTSSPSDEQTLQLHAVLRLALLHLSWVSLALGDCVPALTWASQLLSLDACPAGLKLYAHLYACDALCQLSRSEEALEQLLAALELNEPLAPVASCTGAELPAADGESLDCVRNPYSSTGSHASTGSGRATLYTNLAVVYILRGDVGHAASYVQEALTQEPDGRQTLLCCVYLELHAGRTESALELLKKHRAGGPLK